MNANEQAIYDAVTFLMDYRTALKSILSEPEIERMNTVAKQLSTALDESVNRDPVFKGAFDDAKPWGGTFRAHKTI